MNNVNESTFKRQISRMNGNKNTINKKEPNYYLYIR